VLRYLLIATAWPSLLVPAGALALVASLKGELYDLKRVEAAAQRA
jgi:hypothetical protein